MDADQLLATAQEQTGLTEFGPERDAMVEGLRVLVQSANDDADLSPEGEMAFAGTIGSLLTRRLQIEDWYIQHPEIDDELVKFARNSFEASLLPEADKAAHLAELDHAV